MIFLGDKCSDHFRYTLDNNTGLNNNIFRYGSDAWAKLIMEGRYYYRLGLLNELDEEDFDILESHVGEIDIFEGKEVLIDIPMRIIDEQFMVYTRDNDMKVKYVEFQPQYGMDVEDYT